MSLLFSIGSEISNIHSNLAFADERLGTGLCFASLFTYPSATKEIKKINKRALNINFRYLYYTLRPDCYEVVSSKIPDYDFSHTIIYRKDRVYKDRNNEEVMELFIFIEASNLQEYQFYFSLFDNCSINIENIPKQVIDAIYDKLNKNSPVPVLKDWVPYIIQKMLESRFICSLSKYGKTVTDQYILGYVVRMYTQSLIQIISEGLKNRVIFIHPSASTPSDTMMNLNGLDEYLNAYSDILARKLQVSFAPRHTPNVDKYSQSLLDFIDYASYYRKINLYPAQKDTIQAISNCWDNQKSTFIIGECGVGKTALGIGSIWTHNANKKKMLNIIMCPGHLVKKWQYEIQSLSPLSEVYIINNFEELLSLMPKIKSKKRLHNIWLVLSKETAKLGYDERPAAVWSKSKNCYVCPECGQPLYKIAYEGSSRNRTSRKVYFTRTAFLKKTADNAVCMNKVNKFNPKTNTYKEQICSSKLWEPVTKINHEHNNASEWIKLGKTGWLERCHLIPLYEDLNDRDHLTRDEGKLMIAITNILGDETPVQRSPRKYPLAKFISRFLKGKIDYFIADEMHELKAGDSAQGEAFGDLVFASKKFLGLTGTLLNGYASGIFYILYRSFASMMKKEGFDYYDDTKFTQQYGVVKKTYFYQYKNGRQGNKSGTTKVKALPGVSPLVFTKFLLQNAAFISQDDISDGLPAYTEIPVPIDMDEELKTAYTDLETEIRHHIGGITTVRKALGQMIQMLSIYPDQPYNQPSVIHPDSGQVLAIPTELSNQYRNKENALLELVDRKIEAGEKVLVYYNWVNRTDLSDRLPALLATHGHKSAVLTSNIKSQDREQWIKDKLTKDNIDVLICNPKLVETGLDLLDFTTIIYYQMGYNLYTMRQASRRSWRLSQDKDVEVYFLYYKGTIQEQALSLMASKLQASMAIEGKFSEEGLNALSNNDDIFTQIAASVSQGVKETVDIQVFKKISVKSTKNKEADNSTVHVKSLNRLNYSLFNPVKENTSLNYSMNNYISKVLNNPIKLFNAC